VSIFPFRFSTIKKELENKRQVLGWSKRSRVVLEKFLSHIKKNLRETAERRLQLLEMLFYA
jgi:hypothetical protein